MSKRRFEYISWGKEAEIVKCTHEEWKKTYLFYNKNGTRAKSRTLRSEWCIGNPVYSVGNNGKYKCLYACTEDGELKIYTANELDPAKDGISGTKSIQHFLTMWDRYRNCEETHRTFSRDFGSVPETFKNCIPKQFYYINQHYAEKVIFASCIDDSSHYPWGLLGKLPTSKDSICINGIKEPNEDFPFAFYLRSGNFCEYNGVDTRKWRNSNFFPYLFDQKKYVKVDKENETTVLMKCSNYSLDEIITSLYRIKEEAGGEERQKAKNTINALIGMFHTKRYKSYQYAHLAAVCIARANQKMLDKIEEIGEQKVVHVAIDGCIYLGDKKFGQEKKELGKFVQEFIGCDVVVKKTNVYMAIKDGKVVKFKHGSFNKYKDGKKIKENPPVKFSDMDEMIRENILEGCN